MRKEMLLWGIIGLLLIGIGFNLGVAYEIFGNFTNGTAEIDDYTECRNLDLEETAECLVGYVNEIYKYEIRDDSDKTIEDIKENGGDCYDYNRLYEKMARSLGFHAYSFRIESENVAHRVAIIMDDTGYCKMDMLTKPDCLLFGNF